jgi:hypothetical protein
MSHQYRSRNWAEQTTTTAIDRWSSLRLRAFRSKDDLKLIFGNCDGTRDLNRCHAGRAAKCEGRGELHNIWHSPSLAGRPGGIVAPHNEDPKSLVGIPDSRAQSDISQLAATRCIRYDSHCGNRIRRRLQVNGRAEFTSRV